MPQVGASIAGVKRFFGDRGDTTGPLWQSFRLVLDSHEQQRPRGRRDVARRAQRTFHAGLTWLAPICGEADAKH